MNSIRELVYGRGTTIAVIDETGGPIMFSPVRKVLAEEYFYETFPRSAMEILIILLKYEAEVEVQGEKVVVTHEVLRLEFVSPFETAHKRTDFRNNSLITVIGCGEKGMGEVGLPPKRPGIYLADVDDVSDWIVLFVEQLQANPTAEYAIPGVDLPRWVQPLFHALDTSKGNHEEYGKAGHSGMESALWDLLGHIHNKPVYSLIDLSPTLHTSFYTIGIGDPESVRRSVQFGIQFTSALKLKMGKDIDHGIDTLSLIKGLVPESIIAIDANSSWTPEVALDFLDRTEEYHRDIYMVEQPFPLNSNSSEQWRQVKIAYGQAGIKIFADESVSISARAVSDIAHGVNIKLEKCGGIRMGMTLAKEAAEIGMEVWIGIMVGSTLLVSSAAVLTPYSKYSDLDGALLVKPGVFSGGITWEVSRNCIHLPDTPGFGVTRL